MELSNEILQQIKAEFERRIYKESQPRIVQCLSSLTNQQIWARPNPSSNSIGNIVLHLCGNINQYINSGIGNQRDSRNRDLEFTHNGQGIGASELLDRFNSTLSGIRSTVDKIEAKQLVEPRQVQGFDETVLNILIHVIEHTSYHTGQIAFYTKLMLDQDLRFYGDLDLNAKSN